MSVIAALGEPSTAPSLPIDDAQWDFDAPRFHNFEQGTPPGENADGWFNTSATKGKGFHRL